MAAIQIKLRYTSKEWEILERICHLNYDNNLRGHLYNQIHIIAKKYHNIPLHTESKKLPVNFIIPEDICMELIRFAKYRNIPLTTLISWYTIDPLLKLHYEQEFKLLLP